MALQKRHRRSHLVRKEWAEAYIRGNIGGTKINPERAITLAVRAKLLAEQDGMLAEYQKAKNERSIAEVIVGSVRRSFDLA